MDSLITVEMFEDTEKLAIYFEDKITRQQDEYLFRYYNLTRLSVPVNLPSHEYVEAILEKEAEQAFYSGKLEELIETLETN